MRTVRVTAHGARELLRVPIETVREHPSYDAATDTVELPDMLATEALALREAAAPIGRAMLDFPLFRPARRLVAGTGDKSDRNV